MQDSKSEAKPWGSGELRDPRLPSVRHIPCPLETPIPDATERVMSPEALELELDRLHPAAFGWALACCGGDRAAAEDALQTSYLKILDGERGSAGGPASAPGCSAWFALPGAG